MKKYYLPENGTFYKGNLHCHSVYSDGRKTPEELKKMYKEKGYSVLAITDHEGIFDHSYLNDGDFLTIPGYEKQIDGKEDPLVGWPSVITCHLCFYPKDRSNINCVCFDPDWIHPNFKWMHSPELKSKVTYLGEPYVAEYTPESINHIIEEANKNGFLVTLNHLQWSLERYEQFSRYKGLFAMEIYNTGAERSGNNEYNSAYYDLMLRQGNKMKCVAADDNHSDWDCFGGYVMIKADKLEHNSIISALEKGEFYSTTGPEIKEFYSEDGKVYIKTSPAKKIRFLTGNRSSSLVRAEENETVTEAQFDISHVVDYFRIEVTDQKGEKAYTNACFI